MPACNALLVQRRDSRYRVTSYGTVIRMRFACALEAWGNGSRGELRARASLGLQTDSIRRVLTKVVV